MNPNSCYLSYSRKTPPKWKDMKLIKLCFFEFVHLCFFDKNRLLFSIFDISSILLICVRKCQIGDVRKGLVVKTEIAKNMHKNHYMAKCHFFYYGKRSNGKKSNSHLEKLFSWQIQTIIATKYYFLISPTESTYLVVKFLSAMQRKFSWHSFVGGRRKKNMVCVFVLGIFSNFQAIQHKAELVVCGLLPPLVHLRIITLRHKQKVILNY